MRALASPTSLKGVLTAKEAARALAAGLTLAGAEAEELPVADGGEGTAEVLQTALGGELHEATVSDPLGRPVRARWLLLPDRTAVVESAQAIGLGLLTPEERDPLRASSTGLGELVAAALGRAPERLLIGLGGSATVDGGAGLHAVLRLLPVRTEVLCDVRNPLLGERGAARVFGAQKGASIEAMEELEVRLAGRRDLAPYATLTGAGAAGGLGAALAALGAVLVPGARRVLALLRFPERARRADLVISGEGTIDRTTGEGKAPGEVAQICREVRIPCALFGGRVLERLDGVEVHELSGHPERAREDLVELGERLGRASTSRQPP